MIASQTVNRQGVVRISFEPRGAVRRLFESGDPSRVEEILISGPANTGKSRGALEWFNCNLGRFPGSRALMVRKTKTSLVTSGMVTYSQKVLHPADRVEFFGGSQDKPPAYMYPNGSVFVIGGMDNPDKVLSSEYDFIFVQQAEELWEDDWEKLTTRLRNGKAPFQQLVGDCNPGGPSHWLKQRANRGQVLMLESRHEDNPTFGERDRAVLSSLTGLRRQRLFLGLWAASDGMIYEGWTPAVHLVDRFEIPSEWPRYWALDFGFTNPFVCQWWAEDPDGRLYRYREIYHAQRLVEDHAHQVFDASRGEPRPVAVICDHDAEDRATFERHAGHSAADCVPGKRAAGPQTIAAHKDVSPGIQAVAARLRPAGDGRPRLYYLRDSLVERDEELASRRLPCSTEEEYEGYVWDPGKKQGEVPLKRDDHGMDTTRYMVAHRDLKPPKTRWRAL